MRGMCVVRLGCRFDPIRTIELRTDAEHPFPRFLEFGRCQWCMDWRVTLVSPIPGESVVIEPNHGTILPARLLESLQETLRCTES
jgi:hypothetical protein